MAIHRLIVGSAVFAMALAAGARDASASAITFYNSRVAFDVAVGPTTTDDFGPSAKFPISTGVLDASTNLATSNGGPILPGTVQPGVTYSSPVGTGYFFNIDAGGGFDGGFLDAGLNNQTQPITVTFASPISAFGFDTNSVMGRRFQLTINFVSGGPYIDSFAVANTGDLQFFGFAGAASDISSVVVLSDRFSGFDAAFDNFSITPLAPVVDPSPVPEPATMTMLGLGLGGMALRRFRRKP